MTVRIARVAVAAPLHSLFDYQIPAACNVSVGSRVRVSFGRTRPIAVVTSLVSRSDCPPEKLKTIDTVLDPEPLLQQQDLDFLTWVAAYYHHPPGEVFAAALPLRLRKAETALFPGGPGLRLTPPGLNALKTPPARAPRQVEVLSWLGSRPHGEAAMAELKVALPESAAAIRALRDKGWIEQSLLPAVADQASLNSGGLDLNDDQAEALSTLAGDLGSFSVSLLDGVTGSGKTEVYLQLAAEVLAGGRSVLVLVPEISLTPQLLQRFRERLGDTVRVMHSGLNDTEREQTWHRIRLGLSRVLLGTRSSIFTPIADLGLVLVDEEHDPSFKQMEGFRYSARDLSTLR